MKLKTNSLSSRIYREFYNKKEMPISLCPYFWKLVIAWPITILLLPFTSMEKLFRIDSDKTLSTLSKGFIGAVIYLLMYVAFCIGVVSSAYWITYYEKSVMYANYVNGVIFLVLGSIFTIVFFIGKLKDRIQENKRIKADALKYDENGNWIPIENRPKRQSNILISFIHATYHKYCPKIDWE